MPTNSTLQTLKDSKPELTKTRFNKINSKTKLTKAKFAFSLIEISVVILIIGILIAGISKGMDLYQDYRLTSAQNLTRNSVVNRISDLVAWYETTLPSSF